VLTEPLPSEERGIQFTELLPKNGREIRIYVDTDRWEGFMKFAVGMGPSAMIYVPSFMKVGLGIRKLIGEIRRNTAYFKKTG
jgi:hypothetical protein